jgi:hypothetical protein
MCPWQQALKYWNLSHRQLTQSLHQGNTHNHHDNLDAGWVIQAHGRNPRCVTSAVRSTMTHNPKAARGTCAAEVVTIARDVALALKNLGQKCSEAPCMMRASQRVFERQATSSSTMTKLTLASGWRTTTSLEWQMGRTMTFSSSSSSPFT